jgi:signal transduction histidine kinase
MGPRWARARPSPDPSELLSITDRARHLGALRLGLGTLVIAAGVIWPTLAMVPVVWLVMATVAYLAVSAMLLAVVGRSRRTAMPALQGGLLLDGIYLVAMVGLTSGAASPLRFLLYVHVVAVALLCSYRTGLKLALWDTLLFLWVVQAIEADLLPGAATSSVAASALTIVGMWFLALGTAAFSAAGERELRHQKADLADLSAMVARIDATAPGEAGEIPGILLDQLCATFGFVRGVVLASPGSDLELVAATQAAEAVATPAGLDPLMSRAWSERSSQLVREIDPASDPRLASLLPMARNVMVVPLFLVGGHRLGIVAIERRGEAGAMRRWEVDLVGQFAAHAALALYNAWLTAEREAQLETIKGLEQRQRAHNEELEVKVAERTGELRKVIHDLKEVDEQRRRLLHHVVRAAEDERRRIAHDVHDDPVQKLAAVKMRLEMLAAKHPELPDIAESHKTVASTMRSMRRMLFDLSPPILDEEGIGPALEYFLEHSRFPYRWTVEDHLDLQPSTQTRLILYRTAQEALINARKHAEAEIVRVTLRDRDRGVWMEIQDDGIGFEPQKAITAPGHLGLAAIRERAEMAGGWCSLQSLPGAGTCLQLWFPSDSEAAGGADQAEGQEDLATVPALRDRIAF